MQFGITVSLCTVRSLVGKLVNCVDAIMKVVLITVASPLFNERRRCSDARRLCVCVYVFAETRLRAALVSAAKVMRCIQCCLVVFSVNL